MSKMDSPNIGYIDFQETYVGCGDFGTDFADKSIGYEKSLFYNSCWFKMIWLQNTFTDDISTLDDYIMPSHPVRMFKEYKIK